jgi:hypothetical protein
LVIVPARAWKTGPDQIFFLLFKKKSCFSSFFHILMQSEKYIFENTFWSVYLNQSRLGV